MAVFPWLATGGQPIDGIPPPADSVPRDPRSSGAFLGPRDMEVDNYQFKFSVRIDSRIGNGQFVQDYGDGRVDYNVLSGPSFSCSGESSTCQEVYIIKAQDWGRFCCAVMPDPFVFSPTTNWPGTIPGNRLLPGNPLMNLKSVTATPLDGRTGDPYETDPDCVGGVVQNQSLNRIADWMKGHTHLYQVTLNYEYDFFMTSRRTEGGLDLGRPETYTERSVDVGGEFINIGSRGVHMVDANTTKSGFVQIDSPINNVLGVCDQGARVRSPVNVDEAEVVNDFETAFTWTVPLIEYTLTWPDVWDPPFCAMALALGKVNDSVIEWLDDAEEGTVLFIGASARRQNNVASNGRRLWTLEYRFAKREIYIPINEDGPNPTTGILGWNHHWQPRKKQWGHVLITTSDDTDKVRIGIDITTRSLYLSHDFDSLFLRDNFRNAGPQSVNMVHNTERGIIPFNGHPCGYNESHTDPRGSIGPQAP